MKIEMDIALLQMTQTRINTAKQSQPMQTSSSNYAKESNSFDKVFNDTMSGTNAPVDQQKQVVANDSQAITAEEAVTEVTEVVEATTIEEVFDVLGIEHDEAMLFAEIEGQLIPVEEMMNLEDLTAALGITKEELEAILQQLLGEQMPMNDVWAVLEQTPALLAQITAVLQGESNVVTPKEATKVVEFLKLAETLSVKTDTVYQQQYQLNQTKDLLQSFASQFQSATQQETTKNATFQQVVQQLTQTAASLKKVWLQFAEISTLTSLSGQMNLLQNMLQVQLTE